MSNVLSEYCSPSCKTEYQKTQRHLINNKSDGKHENPHILQTLTANYLDFSLIPIF